MIDFDILQQFITFSQVGTLRETAEKLHISQPTLTRNMQKLEEIFEVPLFCRTKNRISLNETGFIAAKDAAALINQTENMLLRARDFDRKSRTVMFGTCTPVHIPDIVRRISSLYPEATISSEVKSVVQLLEGLNDQTYQLALLPFCPEAENLCSMKWGEEHLHFALPKQHRFAHRKSLRAAEMNGETMLLFQDIGFWYDLVTQKMPDSHFLMQTDRYSFLKLVESSVMPCFTTNLFLDSYLNTASAIERVAVPITDSELNVCFYLVYPKEHAGKWERLLQYETITANNSPQESPFPKQPAPLPLRD